MTDRPENVRIAVPADDIPLFNLLCMLYSENALFPLDKEKALEAIQRATRQQGGIIGIIEHNNKIVGTVGLFLESYWYSSECFLSEYWVFVHPEHRRTDYAKNLIDFSKWCNENMNVMLMMGIISTNKTKEKIILYAKRLQLIGAFFTNGPPNSKGPIIKELLQ